MRLMGLRSLVMPDRGCRRGRGVRGLIRLFLLSFEEREGECDVVGRGFLCGVYYTCDALLSSLPPLLRYRRFFVPFLDTWEGDTHDCMNVLTLLFHHPVLRVLSSLVFLPPGAACSPLSSSDSQRQQRV